MAHEACLAGGKTAEAFLFISRGKRRVWSTLFGYRKFGRSAKDIYILASLPLAFHFYEHIVQVHFF